MRATCVLPDDGADCQSGVALTPCVRILSVSANRAWSGCSVIGHATIVVGHTEIRVELTANGLQMPRGVSLSPAVLQHIAGAVERVWADGVVAQWARRRGDAR